MELTVTYNIVRNIKSMSRQGLDKPAKRRVQVSIGAIFTITFVQICVSFENLP